MSITSLAFLIPLASISATIARSEPTPAWEAHQLKRDIENTIQTRVLDPMLGRHRASVFLDLDLELEIKRAGNTRSGTGDSLRRRKKPPATAGTPEGEDGATQSQHATQARSSEESTISARWVPKRIAVTILHDDSLPAASVEAIRGAVLAALPGWKVPRESIVLKPVPYRRASGCRRWCVATLVGLLAAAGLGFAWTRHGQPRHRA